MTAVPKHSPDLEGVTVRAATTADVPMLGKLGAVLVRTHNQLDPVRFIEPTSHTEEGYGSFLETQIDRAHVILLVAERDKKVVGYSYAGMEGHDWMSLRGPAGVVHDLVVESAQRGKGVGRMLLDATLNALRELGAEQVVLHTAEGNEAAQHLFASAGFRRTMIEMTLEV